MQWMPADMSAGFFVLLVVASFFTSALTGAFGLGGGLLMLVVMSMALPMATVVPLHGIVQLGSNTSRSIIQRKHIDKALVAWFAIGAVLGVLAGGAVAVSIPDSFLKITLALFIAWSVFGRKSRFEVFSKSLLIGGGFFTSMAGMLVGATGPIVAALLASGQLAKHTLVATHAACMVVQHGLKILVFGGLGFAFGPWALLLVLMVASGFLGTVVGARLLDNLPERYFRTGFKLVMGLACAQLLYSAAQALWRGL
ncbi:sulfite exporter TauE/SafE family protein [Lampropedia puyangensis]|uniref:Probable membrane transporter protein n=2 Tax=Lampropedia puyangensis TaxID=1330072 RepID=A0A4S8EVJ9_9BURK|nr:sulfite exporter TauE/SafE family protein [Lampropedia puyangensis]